MAKYTVRILNCTFFTETEMENEPDADEALSEGVRGALMVASDEIYQGAASAVVEVSVHDANSHQVRRVAVSVSVAPLALGDEDQYST